MSIPEPLKVNPEDTNDIRLTKIDTNERDVLIQESFSNEFHPANREEVLAHDLASTQ